MSEATSCVGGGKAGILETLPYVGGSRQGIPASRLIYVDKWVGQEMVFRSHVVSWLDQALSSSKQAICGRMWAGKVRDEKSRPMWVGQDSELWQLRHI